MDADDVLVAIVMAAMAFILVDSSGAMAYSAAGCEPAAVKDDCAGDVPPVIESDSSR